MDDGLLPATQNRVAALEYRVRVLEKYLDTLGTPLWRRILFRLDGWGPWYRMREKPAWRPWRRWYTS
jgi:hypothetical protein